jgi:hypothetical protein
MSYYMIAFVIFVLGAFVLQGIRKIPANPPHKGQATWLGKRIPGKWYDEGWGWFPLFPYLYGFELVNVQRVPFEVVSANTRTPDRAESKIPVALTFRPDKHRLIQYMDSGRESGVKTQLEGRVRERIREWAAGSEEGPMTWVELNGLQQEAISVLIREIAGELLTPIPEYAQEVPTWIWLRYFNRPRPTKAWENEAPWAADNWKRVTDVLADIEANHGGTTAIENLKTAVESRRKDVERLSAGAGNIELADLGIILERLNVGDIDVQGEVAKEAEGQASEDQQRRKEETELLHINNRIQALMKRDPDGPGLTREQALEMVQLTTGKASKTIDAKNIDISPDALALAMKLLGR